MSRRKQKTRDKPKQQQPKTKSVLDSFTNELARLGNVASENFMTATSYPIQRLTRNYNLMNSLYRNSWIAKKVINTVPDDMVKNWIQLNAELKPEQLDRYQKLEDKAKIKEKILEGLYWGRLYGGAACVIMIEGDEDDLDEPLDIEKILPNSFKGLLVLDRWSGIYPGTEKIVDPNDPDFGLPETYMIRDAETGEAVIQRIHHSRIIRFVGRKLPFWEEMAEIYWGASELEHVFDELVKRDNTSWNIASLVFRANLLINKVDGMEQLAAIEDPDAQRDFYNLKSAQNKMINNQSMAVIGTNDDLMSLQYSFAGLNDIYESQMMDIAGSCEIPVTRLFGRSPAGENATGESDLQNYYDMIAQLQQSKLKPALQKLIPIMFMSEFGFVPDDLGIKFNPIATPNEQVLANITQYKVQAIKDIYEAGLITQRTAMQELHTMSDTLGIFTNITDEDIEKANDELELPGENIPSFGDIGNAEEKSLGADT